MNKLNTTHVGTLTIVISIIILSMLSTSCKTTSKVSITKYGMHVNKNYNNCPAYTN